MIDSSNAWNLVRSNALKALKAEIQWHSLIERKSYCLTEVLDNRLVIKRINEGTTQPLTKEKVINAIRVFNEHNCRIKRRHLISPTVAEETALVLFHPNLSWDETSEYIIEMV